jgi:hypothetical protein
VDQAQHIFLAERNAPLMTPADLDTTHGVLQAASRRLTRSGRPVRLLRSTYLPARQRWIGTFTAATADTVHHAFEIAQLPVVEVSEALERPAPSEPAT